ncbi:hypothetical protein MNBD_BACTEROID03-576 [hydrothermal vent metagenome]|uniref:Uncharacterized protein n=1 Tax=hydrothermal vent metagenome TaxID=652676 RepID=A0A3B0U1U0_9ZZZZ
MLAGVAEKDRLLQTMNKKLDKNNWLCSQLKTLGYLYKMDHCSKQKQIKKPYVFDG